MEELSIGDIDADASGPAPGLHVPTEVCENIIDMLYSPCYIGAARKQIATLRSCALVCRDWRVRSQRMLFYRVLLFDTTSLHRLSTTLDAAQHLRDYVHIVVLTGYHLHSTASIVALFPAIFSGKLPNLEQVEITHLYDSCEEWFPRTPDSDPPNSRPRPLPYVPFHPRFPTFLSSFTAVSYLFISGAKFRSFSEFARMLHGFPNLEALDCRSKPWVTPGGSHPGADFTKQPDWTAGRHVLPPFAPKLRKLMLWDMDVYGVERLIWTRGPHLTSLHLAIPPLYSFENSAPPAIQEGIDLSSCTGLQRLTLMVGPQFAQDTDTHAGFVERLIASWKPQRSDPVLLRFQALHEFAVTRRRFADALRILGAITEAASAGDSQNDGHAQFQLIVSIRDHEAEREWWQDHVASCFPTWLRSKRLTLSFHTPRDTLDEWANEEELPRSDPIAAISGVEDLRSLSALCPSLRTKMLVLYHGHPKYADPRCPLFSRTLSHRTVVNLPPALVPLFFVL